MRISVAIDGPAGAGKSTIAKLVAKRFNLMYINTGAMYRAVTLFALKNNVPYTDTFNLVKLIDNLEIHFEGDTLIVNCINVSDEIITPFISNNVSNYAAVPEVRERMVALQRKMAGQYNVIMDGRDIGSVVLNDSKFKFFLTATPEVRAQRRYEELKSKGLDVNFDNLLKEIKDRDYIDSNRKLNPLRQSKDATLIDSSNLNIDGVVVAICSKINSKLMEIE